MAVVKIITWKVLNQYFPRAEKMAKLSQSVPKGDVEIPKTGIKSLDIILQLNLVIQIVSILRGIHEKIINRKEDTLPRIYILVLQNGAVVAYHVQRIVVITWNVSHEMMPQCMLQVFVKLCAAFQLRFIRFSSCVQASNDIGTSSHGGYKGRRFQDR